MKSGTSTVNLRDVLFCSQSPEKLRLAIDGLEKADPEIHETRIDIQPHTGMAIQLHKRLQVREHP